MAAAGRSPRRSARVEAIFISYRRADTAGYGGRLHEHLCGHFGDDRVFRDLDSIAAGSDFAEAIARAVEHAGVMLVVIGQEWLAAAVPTGRRRIDDPDDFVRMEVAAALRDGIPVIPVLVEGASLPAANDLPEDIADVVRYQAIELSDERWAYDVGRLVARLEELVKASGPPVPGEGATPRREPAPRRRRRSSLVLVGVLIVVLLLGSAISRLLGGSEHSAATSRPPAEQSAGEGTSTDSLPAPPADAIPISIGDTVEPGRPDGAGDIAAPGQIQHYSFTGRSGHILYLRHVYDGPCCAITWELLDPSGNKVAGHYMDTDIGRVKLAANGVYVVEVKSNGPGVGTYGFAVQPVPPDTTFQIGVPATVGPGGSTGEGNIASAGQIQLYEFTGTAGQTLYLKHLYDGPCCAITWELLDPSGNKVAGHYMDTDIGRVKLAANGVHVVAVRSNGRGVGTYGFEVTAVP